ncbi:scavenger receptor class B member 1-like [Aricia agestis]|uniref:scavenger receptor class B member 1-like n=1 Tax=Aricia agestis TaxID=91739 RepID=UPI001C20BB3D|nr:scavenger receptor class B member 1-like [Aricia agestis]XP_041970154.1 scavenger receptor class B member 1-like [Aricia agestis]
MSKMESEEMIPTVKIGAREENAGSKVNGKEKNSLDGATLLTCDDDRADYKHWSTRNNSIFKEKKDLEKNKKKKKVKYICKIVCGVILIVLSILGFIYPIRDFMIWDKLNMRPGFPNFDWWAEPPLTTKVKSYLFNVTNHERFLLGLDDKINVQEIGPIVYMEHVVFTNIRFTPNDTLTYRPQRELIFYPELSEYGLNDTVILPNSALLGLTSMLSGSENYFRRMGFKMLLKLYPNNFFVKRTIHQVLWDYRESLMEGTKNFAPGSVNSTNMGFLNKTYELMQNQVTVKIGPRWGHENFFRIYDYEDLPQLTGYDMDTCLDNAINATEGILFPHYLKKTDVPLFFSKSICRLMPLVFDEERKEGSLTLYRYNFSKTAFDNKVDVPEGCQNDELLLPSGIKDGSKCYTGFPMVLSLPHFNGANITPDLYVTGLTPDSERHSLGYYDIEPLTGIPLHLRVRVQCNLWVHDITDLYSWKFNKFANLVLPLVWFEFSQEELPSYITNFLYFVVIGLPIVSNLLATVLLLGGCYLLLKQTDRKKISIGTKQVFKSLRK